MVVHVGDCRTIMRDLDENSVDAIVTDPPYDLVSGGGGGFMGLSWDASGVAFDPATWQAALRVLKPGGHLLAFGGTRTYHRLAVAIEDAGFELRDSIGVLSWVYGSGFPKSLDVGKAIDRRRDDDVRPVCRWLRAAIDAHPTETVETLARRLGVVPGMVGHWAPRDPDNYLKRAVPSPAQWEQLREALGFGVEMDDLVAHLNGRKGQPGDSWADREVTGVRLRTPGGSWGVSAGGRGFGDVVQYSRPATPEAAQWDGWGTALKPSWEPVIVARKPLDGTVAENVLAWGTGGLNIDACRVPHGPDVDTGRGAGHIQPSYADSGRWPPNLTIVHHPDCDDERCADGCHVAVMDDQNGMSSSTSRPQRQSVEAHNRTGAIFISTADWVSGGHDDSGGASRFFPQFRYEAKAGSNERPEHDGVRHPTVKPLDLIRWLVRLVTPPGGTVLDPFLGSGTTAEAAILERHAWVGCELTEAYLPLIGQRVERAEAAVRDGAVSPDIYARRLAAPPVDDDAQPSLFDRRP